MTTDSAIINKCDVDHSGLLGREIKIRSEQFPGKILTSKIVGVNGDYLIIDRSGSEGLVNELISNQEISAFVEYKGQPVIFYSIITSPYKGRLQIPLADKLFPEINRSFIRVPLIKDIKLAYFNDTSISSTRLNRLKWFETKTINLSGGGVLVQVPSDLTKDFYLIMHLGLKDIDLPKLMVGKVRHSQPNPGNQFYVGVEFIIRESYKNILPRSLVANLPPKLFEFNELARIRLDKHIVKSNGN